MRDSPFTVFAGPCVIESEAETVDIAAKLRDITGALPVRFVYKASFDKANRTSADAYRGPGLERGLQILAEVRRQVGVPVMTDIHEPDQAAPAAEVVDVLQIPAFLIRQTDLIAAAARTGKPLNLKKAQFLAPEDMRYVVEKAEAAGARDLYLTERGTTFGYHNLVVDFRSFTALRELGHPVVFDATHSVQIPSRGGSSGGQRQFVRPLARAAAAYGIDGLFVETHPTPDSAPSDAANMLPLHELPPLLEELLRIRQAALPGE